MEISQNFVAFSEYLNFNNPFQLQHFTQTQNNCLAQFKNKETNKKCCYPDLRFQSTNTMNSRGQILPTTLLLPSPPNFQTLLRPLNLVSSSKGHGYGNQIRHHSHFLSELKSYATHHEKDALAQKQIILLQFCSTYARVIFTQTISFFL